MLENRGATFQTEGILVILKKGEKTVENVYFLPKRN